MFISVSGETKLWHGGQNNTTNREIIFYIDVAFFLQCESDMKTRHKLTLASYLNYGEGYSSGINYDEESIKLVNYGRKLTTRPTELRNKAKQQQQHGLNKLQKPSKAKLALVGASIVNGLQRDPDVWQKFTPLEAINLGIGGD